MGIYVGEALTVIAVATDPQHGDAAITDGDAEVEFYPVGANPVTVEADRDNIEYGPLTMAYDATVAVGRRLGGYVAYVDTTGWAPGVRAYRVHLLGSYASWEYGTVKLEA